MASPLRPDMSVRRVAYDHPRTREVFLRHGEEGDRPVFGHLESLEAFARRRGVDLPHLLAELSAAAGVAVDPRPASRAGAHRPFLVAALVLTLILGAGWGAHLLVEIGYAGTFEAASTSEVVAHGMAQLWGFVALFIVGVAARYLPWTTGRPPPGALWRSAVLAALVLGVVANYLWAIRPAALGFLGPGSGALLLAGALGYAVFLWRQLRGRGGAFERTVLASGAWLLLWGGFTLVLSARAGARGPGVFTASDRQVLMDLPLFGLALGSVYGFGQRLLPGFLALRAPRRGLLEATFLVHNSGLACLLAGHLAGRPVLVAAGLVAITLGAVCYVAALRGLRGPVPSPRPERGPPVLRRYVQLAFAWLVLSTAAMASLALVEAARGTRLPHVLHGAARHAFTVGFLVTLVLGVAQRLLPILGRTLLAWPRLAAPILVLLSAGNLLRVGAEAATLRWPASYAVMPFSALLEVTALVLFAAGALRTLWPRPDPVARTGEVDAGTRVAELLEAHPSLEDEMLAWGMDYVLRRREVAPDLTLGTFLLANGFDPEETISRIKGVLRGRSAADRF